MLPHAHPCPQQGWAPSSPNQGPCGTPQELPPGWLLGLGGVRGGGGQGPTAQARSDTCRRGSCVSPTEGGHAQDTYTHKPGGERAFAREGQGRTSCRVNQHAEQLHHHHRPNSFPAESVRDKSLSSDTLPQSKTSKHEQNSFWGERS